METVQLLLARYDVDMAHARHVAVLAMKLFDETQALHELDARARVLIEAGALLHNVGVQVDEANHHTVGRDIVVGAKLKGFSTAERNMLACMVAFHRKAVQPENELLFRVLNQKQQRACLALSALVRVADGLDYSGTQTTEIKKCSMENVEGKQAESLLHSSVCFVHCTGPHSFEDAARAEKKADLWGGLFGPMRISGHIKTPGLNPDDTLAVAGRKLMRYWFGKEEIGDWRLEIENHESPISSLQSSITKKLRVATRRLRSVALVFGEYYKAKHTRELFSGLRAFAHYLGGAREADVVLARAEDYVAGCDADAQLAFGPFVEALQQKQADAYAALRTYVRSKAHQQWVQDFASFVRQTGPSKCDRQVDVDTPSRVRHAARMLLWQHVASVRAFDVVDDKSQSAPDFVQLHAMRIAVKRLRYLAEGLCEVLPENEIKGWVKLCKQAQNGWGEMNDAHVACEQAHGFVQAAQREGKAVHVKAIEAYAHEQARLAEAGRQTWRVHLAPLLEDA